MADIEEVLAANEEKRAVLASLRAHETALVTGVSDDYINQLAAEGASLDSQIDRKLEEIAGHAGVPSTNLAEAKSAMLAAVEKQIEDANAATLAAQAEAEVASKSAIDAHNDAIVNDVAVTDQQVIATAVAAVTGTSVPPELSVQPVVENPVTPDDAQPVAPAPVDVSNLSGAHSEPTEDVPVTPEVLTTPEVPADGTNAGEGA